LTENLIKRLTKEENVAQITTLHVTLGKELNKKIKYIENLENLRKLLQLNLNNHMIEKIEKLDHLTQLRELHLANNGISKIEGLDFLVHLTVLNLSGNMIEYLPAPLFKKLRELQSFLIAHNRLASLIEVTKLRPLQDLSDFSMEGNPMASMEHSRQFVIFQLRSLKCLDGKQVTEDERQMADERFAQGKQLFALCNLQHCVFLAPVLRFNLKRGFVIMELFQVIKCKKIIYTLSLIFPAISEPGLGQSF